MLSESDVLLTVAEVAIAFAGFASLVGILGQRYSSDDPRVSGTRMRGMITFSLMAVGFSLLPFVVYEYGLEEATVWRLSSGLFFLGFLAAGVWVAKLVTRLRGHELVGRRISPLIGTVPFLGAIAGTVLLALNTLVISPRQTPAVYLTCLILLLCMAGFAFAMMVSSFLPNLPSLDSDESPAED
jgi:hypothetical protein